MRFHKEVAETTFVSIVELEKEAVFLIPSRSAIVGDQSVAFNSRLIETGS